MDRKGKELCTNVRNMIVKAYSETRNTSELERALGILRSTIQYCGKKMKKRDLQKINKEWGMKRVLTDRDKNKLLRVVNENRRRTYEEITGIVNGGISHRFCIRTLKRKIQGLGYKRRVSKKKVAIRDVNKKALCKQCKERIIWTVDHDWSKRVFCDKSQIVNGKNQKIYIWRKDDEKYNAQLVFPPSRRRLSIMIWGCVCIWGIRTLTYVEGNINAKKYIELLNNNLWPVSARHIPDNHMHLYTTMFSYIETIQ